MVGQANGENRDRNGHVLVWEQPGLEEGDVLEYKRKKGKHVPCLHPWGLKVIHSQWRTIVFY